MTLLEVERIRNQTQAEATSLLAEFPDDYLWEWAMNMIENQRPDLPRRAHQAHTCYALMTELQRRYEVRELEGS